MVIRDSNLKKIKYEKQLDYKVFIGKYEDLEINFIAQKGGQKIYIQVAYLIESEKTYEREFHSLMKIKDNFPKYIISLDDIPESNNEGIKRMNLIRFLLEFEG